MSTAAEDIATPRVMVVEDEGIIARDIQRILTRLGYEVVGHATSGKEAMETLAMVRADIALMDIRIRGELDGIQTAALAWERFHLPVVFLTAHADRNTLRRATETAPFGYIVKPFTEAGIQVALEVALARYRLQQRSDDRYSWLNTALHSLSDAVVMTDFDGRVSFLNQRAEQFLGWTAAEAMGASLDKVAPLQNADGSEAGDWTYGIPPAEPVVCPAISLEGRRGARVEVVASVAPLRQPGGNENRGLVLMLRPVARPVTAIKEEGSTERRLQEISFALTHDLREPVRNIGCFAQMLERRETNGLDDDSREYLRYIIDGSRKMDGLLLGLHRYHYASEATRDEHAVAEGDESLKAALLNLRTEMRKSGASVFCKPLPQVACAGGVLTEIFQILLTNSLQYRAERELEITVEAVVEGQSWVFSVADNGLGVEVEQQDKVFTLFKKAHNQTLSGAGIGLAIARRFVELYGGKIWMNGRPGEGATVSFTLLQPKLAAAS